MKTKIAKTKHKSLMPRIKKQVKKINSDIFQSMKISDAESVGKKDTQKNSAWKKSVFCVWETIIEKIVQIFSSASTVATRTTLKFTVPKKPKQNVTSVTKWATLESSASF